MRFVILSLLGGFILGLYGLYHLAIDHDKAVVEARTCYLHIKNNRRSYLEWQGNVYEYDKHGKLPEIDAWTWDTWHMDVLQNPEERCIVIADDDSTYYFTANEYIPRKGYRSWEALTEKDLIERGYLKPELPEREDLEGGPE